MFLQQEIEIGISIDIHELRTRSIETANKWIGQVCPLFDDTKGCDNSIKLVILGANRFHRRDGRQKHERRQESSHGRSSGIISSQDPPQAPQLREPL